MTEKSYYSDLTKYYTKEAIRIKRSIGWEAKFSRTQYINFKCLPAHQEEFLLQCERSAFGYKIPDAGIGQKPGDGIVLYNAVAIFVAIYYLPRETEIYEIPIRKFLHEKYTSGKASMSKEKASQIGKRIFL